MDETLKDTSAGWELSEYDRNGNWKAVWACCENIESEQNSMKLTTTTLPLCNLEIFASRFMYKVKKGFSYSATSTGHSTTARGVVPVGTGTGTSNVNYISTKSSERAASALGFGDDDPDDDDRKKCLEGSDSSPPLAQVKIGRREQLHNLNPSDVILVLDGSSPVEERSEILRAGQARNFQFVQNRSYYEAFYHCICRNTENEEGAAATEQAIQDRSNEDQVAAAAVLEPVEEAAGAIEQDNQDYQHAEEDPVVEPDEEAALAIEPENGADADYVPSESDAEDSNGWIQFPFFFQENIGQNIDLQQVAAPAVIEDEEAVPDMQPHNAADGDYVPSESDTDESDNWLQFPLFFEEDVYRNLDLPAVNEVHEAEDEEVVPDIQPYHAADADYVPSESDTEDSDQWLQFPLFFEEDVQRSLDLPAINEIHEAEVPVGQQQEQTSDEQDSDSDYAQTEDDDPAADEEEWLVNVDFMDDLYSDSESIDDTEEDPDYLPSSGSDSE